MPALHAIILVLSFLSMEGVAWFTHKYIMHGVLWTLHRDHHKKDHHHPMERNDFFFALFAAPGILLLYAGLNNSFDWRFWMGAGISVYGLAYFLVHDLFIHQRLRVFRNTDNAYLKGLRRAHKIHHRKTGREQGECFGMLWVPFKYRKEARGKL